MVLLLAIQLSPIQNWLVKKVTNTISEELKSEVHINHVRFSLFDKMNVEGLLVKDRNKDTLLYAGALRVRITDWFFLKNKIDLKYIGLEDAVVHLLRSHSAKWNYQYIIDHYSPKKTDTTKLPQPKKHESNFILDLKKLDFKNVCFIQNDEWRGEKMTIKVDGLLMDAKKVDLPKVKFLVNTLELEKPQYFIEEFDGFRPDSIRKKDLAVPDDWVFNPGIWLSVDSLTLKNGIFTSDIREDKHVNHFDGSHIKITQLTGSLNHFTFINDTMRAAMDIACKERCGFDLKKLKAQMRITPQIIELAKLDLRTNKSRLTDYYAMHYKHFVENFNNYITQVEMVGKMKAAKIHSDDVAFFAPELKNWKKEVVVSGNFKGTVADFDVKNLFASTAGGASTVSGNLSMKGLPNINSTNISLTNGVVKTNSAEVGVFAPIIKQFTNPNLAALGTVFYRGNYNGTIRNFKAKGVVSTSIGALDADIAMQFPKVGEPTYEGAVTAQRFNLGKFVNSTQLGTVNFKGNIKGTSFRLSNVNTKLNGFFEGFEFNGYNYTNIKVDGSIANKFFSGELKVDDPNFDLTSSIEINLTGNETKVNILGDLVNSNFKKLNLSNQDIQLTGLLDLNFTGNNIDDFLGTAKILNANLLHDSNKLSFDSLVLNTQIIEGAKKLTLTSNEFSLTIEGKNYQLLDLPNAFQTYLHHYYPSYFIAPVVTPVNQDFTVTLFTKDFDKYARILDKKLGGIDYATIIGSVNTNTNKFSVSADLPTLRYDQYQLSGVVFAGAGTLDSLKIKGNIMNTRLGDSINFPNTMITVASGNDHSTVSLQVQAENQMNEANIQADITTLEDGLKVNFNPSYFMLNSKKWNLEKRGEIIITRDNVSAENVKFTQGLQEIKVESEKNNDTGIESNLVVKLKDVVIGDITSLFMKSPQLEGLANGDIHLNDFYGAFNVETTLQAEQFRVDNDSLGIINLNAKYNNASKMINFKASSPNKNYLLNAEGHYNLKDTSEEQFLVNSNLFETKLGFLQQFLGDIFSDITGKATGTLTIKGHPDHPDLLGNVKVYNAGLRVNYTQVYYSIDSATINFVEDGINFNQFTIKDRFKNKGSVKGKLFEKGFKNMAYDFSLSTGKLLLIDTKAKDNKQFYGKAIGKASVSFKGPEYNAILKIVGESNDSSHIYIPSSINKESGDADFIVFKKYGTEMLNAPKNSNFNMTVDMDLTANNNVKIDVLLDEMTGDVIKAVGNGRLKILVGTSSPLSMKGRYNIDRGSYDFNFQSFIRKPFDMLPGSGNYIEWTGDPLKADLHIDAQYTAERVSLGDLIANQQATVSNSTKSYRGTVYVIASLRDKLIKPTITFGLDFPQGSPIKTDAVFGEFINRVESDQAEMLSQATSLIVFGTFAPYGQGVLSGSGGNTFNNFGVNTISQLLTKQVNKAVSNLLYKLTRDRSLRFDLGTSVYSSSSILDQSSGLTATSNNRLDRTNINFKVGKSFFNDNVVVTFGGDLDFNLGTTSTIANGNFQWLPDLNIELILTPDKRLRSIVFSKNSLDISGSTLGRRNRQGVSLSYKKDFDSFLASKSKQMKIPYRESTEPDYDANP